MKKTKAPKPVYKANDGSEHATAFGADKRNELLAARRNYEDAARLVSRLMAEGATTSDGQPFDWMHWSDYWYLHHGFRNLPYLIRVAVWPYDTRVEIDRRDENAVLVCNVRDDRDGKVVAYKINELYYDEKKAKEAHIAACHKRLEELTADVAKMAQREI